MTVSLVQSMSGVAHRSDCYAIRQITPEGRPRGVPRKVVIYKVLAPELPVEEVPAFLKARKIQGCGACCRVTP